MCHEKADTILYFLDALIPILSAQETYLKIYRSIFFGLVPVHNVTDASFTNVE